MKKTTKTATNQKFFRKVQKESVEATETISLALKTLAMIHWTSSLSQWEPFILGKQNKISKRANKTKCPKI